MSVTGKQIAMARILLDMSQKNLADSLGLARKTIMRIEAGQSPGSAATMEKIQTYFENSNVQFIGTTGVTERSGDIKILKGPDGLRMFLDDLYQVASTDGGTICLYNAKPAHWTRFLSTEWWDIHAKRMRALGKKIDFRIISEHGDMFFMSNAFATYKWFPPELFNDQPVYAYGTKLAFVTFTEIKVSVSILDNKAFTQGFRTLFNIAWERIALETPNKIGNRRP